MKAWVMTAAGGPDVLQLKDIDRPVAGNGEVLIRVLASGFNPLDAKIRAGLAKVAPESGILGCDVCGVIEAVGPGVTSFNAGDRVFGMAGGVKGTQGSLAEYLVADAALLAVAPKSLSDEQAAAVPLVALTADEALRRLHTQSGETVYISGASGGVGQMALQLAVNAGCKVTGSAGTAQRVEQIKAFGAEGILHSEAADLIAQGRTFAKVLDTHGGESLQIALQLAAVNGQAATINARAQYDLTQAHSKALTLHAIFVVLPLIYGNGRAIFGQRLQDIAQQLDSGKLKPLETDVFPMSDVQKVHRQYEEKGLKNKLVMTADF